jgi:hypothetical protein
MDLVRRGAKAVVAAPHGASNASGHGTSQPQRHLAQADAKAMKMLQTETDMRRYLDMGIDPRKSDL